MTKLLPLLLIVGAVALAQPTSITVTGPVYLPFTTDLANGSVTITRTSVSGAVLGGTKKVAIVDGAFGETVSLVPGHYTVGYTIQRIGEKGAVTPQAVWTVPVSGGPYTVQDVQSTTGTPPSASFAPSQINAGAEGRIMQVVGGVSAWTRCGGATLSQLTVPLSSLTSTGLGQLGAACPSGTSSGGAEIPSVLTLIRGDGSGGAADSGISPTSVVTLADTQVLTNKTVNLISPTIFGYLANLTSDVQAQLTGKQASLGYTPLNAASNLSDVASASTARTNLGLGTAATQASTAFDAAGSAAAAQAAAIAASAQRASNLSDLASASTARTNLGLGTAATQASTAFDAAGAATAAQAAAIAASAQRASNLSDLASASAARTNLGLATVASTASASDISAGTLAAARGGAGTISGALKANGSGVVSQAACADLSNAAASCATDATNANNIGSGTLPSARLPEAFDTLTPFGAFAPYGWLQNSAIGVSGSGNQVRVWGFTAPQKMTAGKISYYATVTSSVRLCLFDASGTLLSSSPADTSSSSGNGDFQALSPTVTLNGNYWIGTTSSSTSTTMQMLGMGGIQPLQLPTPTMSGTCANASTGSAGSLACPATCGAVTTNSNGAAVPFVVFWP